MAASPNRGGEDEDSVYISLDAQNILGRDGANNQGIVGLINILKQLHIISGKTDRTFQLETIAAFWTFKEFTDRIKEFSRVILVSIWPEDRELDDYLVTSLASAHDGFYVSNDKSMHQHIGKDDDWAKMHRIGFKRVLLKKPTLRYFCPICNEQFSRLNKDLLQHRLETGHACRICEDCSEILPSKKSVDQHKKSTGHEDYSGHFFKPINMRITEDSGQEVTSTTKSIELLFPDGPLSDTYNELKDKGELFVKNEEWELQYLEDFDEAKRKQVPKYFCPVCDEKFQSWSKGAMTQLKQHMLETGHACRICEDCSAVLPTAGSFNLHKKQTGHENYSGESFTLRELKITKDVREEERKEEAAEAKKRTIEEAVKEIYGSMTETDLEKLVIKCYNEILGEEVGHMLKVSFVEQKGFVCHFSKEIPSLRAKFIGDKADTVNQVRKLLSKEIGFENPEKMHFFVDEDSE